MSAETSRKLRTAAAGRRRTPRRGAAALEFALTAIPLFLFIFASIEFGRALMSVQSLEEAARAGCRASILDGSTTQKVNNKVASVMQMSGISTYTVTTDPSSLSSAKQWDPITVEVSATFGDMSWLPLPIFFLNQSFSASCTMPFEGGGT